MTMRRFLASFSTTDWLFVLVSIGFVGWLEITKPAALDPLADRAAAALPPSPQGLPEKPYHMPQSDPLVALRAANPPTMYNAASELRLAADVPTLTPEAETILRKEMPKWQYFGALAVGEGEAFGWSNLHGTLRAAHMTALAHCDKVGNACRVIAEVTPKSMPNPAPRDSLSFVQSQIYRQTASGTGPRAYARSLDGAYGSAAGASVADAEAKALAICQSYLSDQNELHQIFPCEVMGIWR
jgi:hypothetical protein